MENSDVAKKLKSSLDELREQMQAQWFTVPMESRMEIAEMFEPFEALKDQLKEQLEEQVEDDSEPSADE